MRVVSASLVALSTFSFAMAVPVDARDLSSTLSGLTGGGASDDSTSYGSPGAGNGALVASVSSLLGGDGSTVVDAALAVSLCDAVNSLSGLLGIGDGILACDSIPASPPSDCSASPQVALGPQSDDDGDDDGSDDSNDDSDDDSGDYDSGDEFDDGSDDSDDSDQSFSTAVVEEPTSTADSDPVASPPPNIYAAPVPTTDSASTEPCLTSGVDSLLDVAVSDADPLLEVAVHASSNLLDTGSLLGGGDALGTSSLIHAALGSGTNNGDDGLLGLTHIGL